MKYTVVRQCDRGQYDESGSSGGQVSHLTLADGFAIYRDKLCGFNEIDP